jgi:hypothetical protein
MFSLTNLNLKSAALAVVLGASLAAAGSAHAQPLRRNLADYFIFAQTQASLKNFQLDTACNIGVNCAAPTPGAKCGSLSYGRTIQVVGSQTVGDQQFFRKPGAVVGQVFRNSGGPLTNVTILTPPEMPFATPIIAGTCAPGCIPNNVALEAECGFPVPFPACDPAKDVKATAGQDCTPAALDILLGNGQCDLAPGQYGDISVQSGATANLDPGDYDTCSFTASRNTNIQGPGAVINVNGGVFKISNGSTLGTTCGDFTVRVDGGGNVSFGRNVFIAAKVCAPDSILKLGHNNTLLGQFVGDIVNADLNNKGGCCGGRCACFDTFSPTSGTAGTDVTMTSACDLSNVTDVLVCGVPANIVSQAPAQLVFDIPNGLPPGPCDVEIVSPSGTFLGNQKLTIN